MGEPARVGFHLVTQDKGAASDEPGSPCSHEGWWIGCLGNGRVWGEFACVGSVDKKIIK